VLNLVQQNGYYDEAVKIMDYYLPEKDKTEFTNYRFDFLAVVNPGGSEGIYIDCYLRGEFDQSGKRTCEIGTFKTLGENMNAFRIMGALSGALTFYASQYVNANIERYTPDAELAAQAERERQKSEGESQ
jgi:hypothetical protein